jgi:hypothetical protein
MGTILPGPPASGRHLFHEDLFRPVEVPEQRYFGTVVQYLLVHPPDRVDEDVLGIAAIRIGAPPTVDSAASSADSRVARHAVAASLNAVTAPRASPGTTQSPLVREWLPVVQSAHRQHLAQMA